MRPAQTTKLRLNFKAQGLVLNKVWQTDLQKHMDVGVTASTGKTSSGIQCMKWVTLCCLYLFQQYMHFNRLNTRQAVFKGGYLQSLFITFSHCLSRTSNTKEGKSPLWNKPFKQSLNSNRRSKEASLQREWDFFSCFIILSVRWRGLVYKNRL